MKEGPRNTPHHPAHLQTPKIIRPSPLAAHQGPGENMIQFCAASLLATLVLDDEAMDLIRWATLTRAEPRMHAATYINAAVY
jgi:hypothetical protein